ncbi:MAG: hypothetical protein ACI8U1_002664, partial [Rheinheimera aquimaris]
RIYHRPAVVLLQKGSTSHLCGLRWQIPNK